MILSLSQNLKVYLYIYLSFLLWTVPGDMTMRSYPSKFPQFQLFVHNWSAIFRLASRIVDVRQLPCFCLVLWCVQSVKVVKASAIQHVHSTKSLHFSAFPWKVCHSSHCGQSCMQVVRDELTGEKGERWEVSWVSLCSPCLLVIADQSGTDSWNWCS